MDVSGMDVTKPFILGDLLAPHGMVARCGGKVVEIEMGIEAEETVGNQGFT